MAIDYSPTPSRYPPSVTYLILVVNLLVTLMAMTQGTAKVEGLSINHSLGVEPLLWITSPFVHFQMAQFIGSAIFIAAFGLMIEGRIGPMPFLIFYLAIAVSSTAADQVMMKGKNRIPLVDDTQVRQLYEKMKTTPLTKEELQITSNHEKKMRENAENLWHIPVGASSVIMGLVMIFLIIAPESQMRLGDGSDSPHIPLMVFAGAFLIVEAGKWYVTGFRAGILPTQLLGIVPGLACGFLIKSSGMSSGHADLTVGAEGDGSAGSGKPVVSAAERKAQAERLRKDRQEAAEQLEIMRRQSSFFEPTSSSSIRIVNPAIEKAQVAMEEKKYDIALKLIDRVDDAESLAEIAIEDYNDLYRNYSKQKKWKIAATVLEKSIMAHAQDDTARRLQLARILLAFKDAENCHSVLAKVQRNTLSSEQRNAYQKLVIQLREIE